MFGSFLLKATLSVSEEAEQLEAAFFLDKLLTTFFCRKLHNTKEPYIVYRSFFYRRLQSTRPEMKSSSLGFVEVCFVGFCDELVLFGLFCCCSEVFFRGGFVCWFGEDSNLLLNSS